MQEKRDDRIDQAIEKTLAGLRQASPPAGLESRIEHRLQQHQRAAELHSGWRDMLRGSTVAGGWLRGAFSGACVATVVVVALLSLHRTQRATQAAVTVYPNSGSTQTFPKLVVEQRSHPCTPAVLQAKAAPAPHATRIARGALPENHRQPLELPLTQQERDLVRLVHIAGPQQLAGMTEEAQASARAEDAAAFQKFFTPPAPPKPISEPAAPIDPTSPAGTAQSSPEPQSSETTIGTAPETAPAPQER